MSVPRAAALVCAALALGMLLCACSPEPKTAPEAKTAAAPIPAESSLPPVVLPELSRMEKSVQQQMTDAHRSLTARIENHAPPDERGAAYGDLGNLLQAAEYFDAAEACYLHAQALAPNDVRWPYYLGHVYMTKAQLGKAAASFERALQLQPNDVAALIWLGGVHLDLGESDRAVPLFVQALSLQPRLVAAQFGLGRAAWPDATIVAPSIDSSRRSRHPEPRSFTIRALAYRGLGDDGTGRRAPQPSGEASRSVPEIR